MPDEDWTGFHPIEQALWVDGHDRRDRARSPTSSCADVGTLDDRVQTSSCSRRRSPTARSSCSARCRSRRSPARRSATRTPTSSTSRPTSRAPGRRSTRCGRSLAQKRRRARRRRSTQRFAASTPRSQPYRRGRRLRLLHRADPADTREALARSIDALAEPLSQVASDRRRRRADAPDAGSRRRAPARRGRRRRAPALAAAAASPARHARGRRRRRTRRGDGTGPVLRRPPGRHRDAGAGPAALRRLRPRSPTAATSCATCCATWTSAAARMTAGPAGRRPTTTTPTRRPTTPARRSGLAPRG